ncbi:unnamed protein product [Symbiodinium sp. CCMP2592]|nr:unnamed protein product [Symbiodinium sp. CCMP2592]
MQRFNFSVQLVLLHGGHLQNLDTFNQILDMKKYSPSRAIWGTRYFFCAVISKELLLNGAYELPYNMPPGLASTRGHPGLTISLTGLGGGLENQPQTVQYDGDLALAELDKGGQAFWQSQGFDTVALPWLPFFSNCEGFDSYITLWDLFESPGDQVRDGCDLYTAAEVEIVQPLIINFDTLQESWAPVADNCNFITKCNFEERLPEGHPATLWWALDEEVDLFYITTFPILFEELQEKNEFGEPIGGLDPDVADAFFSSMEGTEALTAVSFETADRSLDHIGTGKGGDLHVDVAIQDNAKPAPHASDPSNL